MLYIIVIVVIKTTLSSQTGWVNLAIKKHIKTHLPTTLSGLLTWQSNKP